MDNKITPHLVYLADNLGNLERILLYLIQNKIISLNESDEIRKENTPFNQNVKLLRVIQKKDFPINIFLEILRNTNNGHCVNKIEGILPKINRKLEKPKILKSHWWPDKKLLIESLHKRKIGDKLLIEILHDRISTDKRRMLVICESVDASKLTGMGGVGKTLTATWYGHHYEEEYDQVIWIDCGEDSLLKSFQKLALDLKIEERNEIVDLEDFTRKSYEALEEFKCLWIFDNAETYKGEGGIKEVLPKYKDNFYCLITSRWREWGIANIGYGEISRLELNIFGESESLEFFKENLKQEIKYTEYQLKQLSRLLGNLPLAMQLAVAALNTGNIDLKNYIEKTSTKDLENIVDTQFDAYEKTINECVSITLELIGKEEGGCFAKEVLNVFGYIRPDNVLQHFLKSVFKPHSDLVTWGMRKAIQLLTKYSLITAEFNHDKYMTLLSIHRLLQQVIRHNGRKSEKKTLRKIIGCEGFVDYKLIPFTKCADPELKKEFSKVKAELLDQWLLVRLVNENRFEESAELANFIDQELKKDSTKLNYAICLEMNGQLEENIKVLEELYQHKMKEDRNYHDSDVEMGLLNLDNEVAKSLVGGHLLVSHWKIDNTERMQEILEEGKSFKILRSQEMTTTLLRILDSDFIQSNYSLVDGLVCEIVFDGNTKEIILADNLADLSVRLPNDLQELGLTKVRFKNSNAKYTTNIDLSDWLPTKLNTLKITFVKPQQKISSLGFISSIENMNLYDCSLSLDSVNRISPRQLKLEYVSFLKNGEELPNVNITEFIGFHKMKRLELVCYSHKKNFSIDLSEEESANIEYLELWDLNVVSLKSANDKRRVNIKTARIGRCSLDLSVLPPSLQKLSLRDAKVFVSGEIDLPNLEYLDLKEDISPLSHFHSFQLRFLHLRSMTKVNTDILPPSLKIVIIDEHPSKDLVGGVINLDTLILYGFSSDEVEKILPHFNTKQLVLDNYWFKPVDLYQWMTKKIPTIAIGRINWRNEDFENSIMSKQLDRKAEYYLLSEGKGKTIEQKDFDELYLLKHNCGEY